MYAEQAGFSGLVPENPAHNTNRRGRGNPLGAEHLLAAMLQHVESDACPILADAGLTFDGVQREIDGME